jgi:hypothetical protein
MKRHRSRTRRALGAKRTKRIAPSESSHRKASSETPKAKPSEKWGESASSMRLVPTGGQDTQRPRFYGGGPMTHAPIGRQPTNRTARRKPQGPPVALIVGGPCALVLVLVVWLVTSGGEPPRAPKATAAPAATAQPQTQDNAPQAEPERPARPSAPSADARPTQGLGQDTDEGEETEAEAKARLDAVDRARAAESKWMDDLGSRTGQAPDAAGDK